MRLLYLELLKLDVGLDVGEELAVWVETFLIALLLSDEAVGELQEPLEWCTDFEDLFFLLSWGDLRQTHVGLYENK